MKLGEHPDLPARSRRERPRDFRNSRSAWPTSKGSVSMLQECKTWKPQEFLDIEDCTTKTDEALSETLLHAA
jgi:hypothetical protein